MKRHKPPTREEIESTLARLRKALSDVSADSPAAIAFRMAITRNEAALAAEAGR